MPKLWVTYTVEVLLDTGRNQDVHDAVCDQSFTAENGEAVFFNVDRAVGVKRFTAKAKDGTAFLDDVENDLKQTQRYIGY